MVHGCCLDCWPLLVNADARPCSAPRTTLRVIVAAPWCCATATIQLPSAGTNRLLPAGSGPLTPGELLARPIGVLGHRLPIA